MLSPVLGVLLSRRLAGRLGDNVGLAVIGDGGMSAGAVHEALNIAAIERLPFILQVADNRYSYSTTSDRSYACAHLIDRAAAYGFAPHRCGTDADAA
jgi:pyruvate dehydrogenase E1 component alpha subunit/2-oxoisovalerate dehydrogenase E1 component alpha subunit